jgi:uncharacterized protein YlbG (UPF0298 family)
MDAFKSIADCIVTVCMFIILLMIANKVDEIMKELRPAVRFTFKVREAVRQELDRTFVELPDSTRVYLQAKEPVKR